MASGELSAEALIGDCLQRIENREADVQAWESLDPEFALQQARQADKTVSRLPLQGVPIGIKDIIETKDFDTCHGSPAYKLNRPHSNAAGVDRLISAGAVIMGKTVTTEFAYLNPGKTRNPNNLAHTPGGSSSGSAAAVADGHVPVALGTQTAGSIIRPASFCGVVGYKPTLNSFPITGIHAFAPSFDTLGAFSRSIEDMVLLRNVLASEDHDVEPCRPEKVAVVRSPVWDQAQTETVRMIETLENKLDETGIIVSDLNLSEEFDAIHQAHVSVMLSECVSSLSDVYENHRGELSEKLKQDYEVGMQLDAEEIQKAYDCIALCRKKIAEMQKDFDVIITPSAPGYAPAGLQATGDPAFNRMWTALSLPCISLPTPVKKSELPLGVQLVGAFNEDIQLLSHARWLESFLAS